MIKTLITILGTLLSGITKGVNQDGQESTLELAKLKISLVYLKSIKTFRVLFMSLFAIGTCIVLMTIGIILFHIILLVYFPWSIQTKVVVSLGFVVAYFIAVIFICAQLFLESKWLRIFHAEALAQSLMREPSFDESVILEDEKIKKNPTGKL